MRRTSFGDANSCATAAGSADRRTGTHPPHPVRVRLRAWTSRGDSSDRTELMHLGPRRHRPSSGEARQLWRHFKETVTLWGAAVPEAEWLGQRPPVPDPLPGRPRRNSDAGAGAFVTDVCSRMIVGWQLATRMRTDRPLDALEMALWRRGIKKGPPRFTDAGPETRPRPRAHGFRWDCRRRDRRRCSIPWRG